MLGVNSYLYVGGNLVVRVDESGNNWKEKFIKGLANFAKSKVNKLLSTAIYNTTKSTKKIKVYDKDGTFIDTVKDFNNLPLSNLKIKIRYMPKLPFNDKPLGTGFGPIDTMVGAFIDELF